MAKLKGLIALLVVAGGFYVAWNMIPPYFHNYQFQDDLDDIARRNSYTMRTDDDLKKIVIAKAESEEIALKEEQISIQHTNDGLGITVRYHVHVDMVVAPMDKDFVVNSMNKRI